MTLGNEMILNDSWPDLSLPLLPMESEKECGITFVHDFHVEEMNEILPNKRYENAQAIVDD